MKKIKICFIGKKVKFFGDKEEFNRYMLGLTGEDYSEDKRAGLALEVEDNSTGETQYIIYADEKQSMIYYKSTVVHEISHIVDYISEKHGFKCTENRAYLTGYIYRKIIKYIDKETR